MPRVGGKFSEVSADNGYFDNLMIGGVAVGAAGGRFGAFSLACIGDSIAGGGVNDFNDGTTTPAQAFINTKYANGLRGYNFQSWVVHACGRSGRRFYPHSLSPFISGATSSNVLSHALPILLGAPDGLPDICAVMCGVNDAATSTPLATFTANLTAIYQTLLAAGILPVACTLPPCASYPVEREHAYNRAITRIAASLRLPLADMYSPLASVTTGLWERPVGDAAPDTLDNVHPSAQGAYLMGHALWDALQYLARGPQYAMFTDQAVDTTFERYPAFTSLAAGVINTVNSYPTGWNAPAAGLATVFNSAGGEPGTQKTMRPMPVIAGRPLRYWGNAYSFNGNGSGYQTGPALGVAPAAGDLLAVSFRLRCIGAIGAADPMVVKCGLWNYTTGAFVCGLDGQANLTVGEEAAHPAADLYFEWRVPTAAVMPLTYGPVIAFRRGSGISSNVGDSLAVANFQVTNLTKGAVDTL